MAGSIRVLDGAIADQIAAGEVVERPASVVKELLENAIDAGATRVDIELEAGGCALIRVVDDGLGMSGPDAALSVRRHATSKLATIADLERIATLGFRGEALPSIASVSRFQLGTRERAAICGTQVDVEAGGEPRVREIGCAHGTAISVRDLFFNVPARLKFLKSRPTEAGHAASVCTRAALANPELTLTLKSDGRMTRQFLRAGSLLERARNVFTGESLVSIEADLGDVSLVAALGAPERARSGALGLHLLVNGRPVRDAGLARAVAYAYGSVLPPGRYPIGVLHLRLAPEQVDVNVHPQKLEIRLRNARDIFERVTRALAKQLGTSAWSGPGRRDAGYWHERLRVGPPQDAAPQFEDSGISEPADGWGLAPAPALASFAADGMSGQIGPAPSLETALTPQTALLDRGFFGSLRVLGQVRRMLLICEGAEALYVVDQHAADERVRFFRLRRAYEARSIEVQQLLFPDRVRCTELEAAWVEQHQGSLEELGLECSVLGPGTVAVHSVPALLARAAPERLLRDLLAELERAGERNFSAAVDRALATMACHAAIRAGDPLPTEQAEALLRSLDEVSDFAQHCPHGRPIVHTIRLDDLEHKLGR